MNEFQKRWMDLVFYKQIDQIQEVIWSSIGILFCIGILIFLVRRCRIHFKSHSIIASVMFGLFLLSQWLSEQRPPIHDFVTPTPTPTPSLYRDSTPKKVPQKPPIAPISTTDIDRRKDPAPDPVPTITPPPPPDPTKTKTFITLPSPWQPRPTPTVTPPPPPPPTPTPTPIEESRVYTRPAESPRFEAVRVDKVGRGVKVRLFDSRKDSWLDDELHILEREPRVGTIVEVAEVRAVYVGAKNIPGATEPVR